jgi:tRNA-(ms[2]io[6]A)-hydroxylase|tara:strand:- start:9814 stop:10440 length:627 start_codon:yes stop_codon:yes gene_type:complete
MLAELSEILTFLPCATPEAWVANALENQDLLLIDHANCEKKAAMNAIQLTFRHNSNFAFLNKMSRLAREEMRHFEQVIAIMEKRKITYRHLSASRYASNLHKLIRDGQKERLVDMLIIGAYIEARSCERFARIASELDEELCKFYSSLLKSEARHYKDYLALARQVTCESMLNERINTFGSLEREIIESPDHEFRFHSGPVPTRSSLL